MFSLTSKTEVVAYDFFLFCFECISSEFLFIIIIIINKIIMNEVDWRQRRRSKRQIAAADDDDDGCGVGIEHLDGRELGDASRERRRRQRAATESFGRVDNCALSSRQAVRRGMEFR